MVTVAAELAELARRRASGAVHVNGDPGGTVYLDGGRLAFAESSAVPDLGSRLVNSRRLGVDQWHRAQRDSQAGGCAGDLLLRRGTRPDPDLLREIIGELRQLG